MDLLGTVLTEMWSQSARTGLGQFYTPAELCDLMARMTGVEENSSFQEPSAGTGGMPRAAAKYLREQQKDPTTVTWYAVDIDPLAIACLAANSVVCDPGNKVVLGVAESSRKMTGKCALWPSARRRSNWPAPSARPSS